MKKLFFTLLLFVSACQTQPTVEPTEAGYSSLLNGWLGKPKTQLLSVWGEPQHDYWKSNVNYVLYTTSSVADASNGATIDRMPRIANDHKFYQNPQGLITRTCTTLFKLEENRITSWKYEGNACKAYE